MAAVCPYGRNLSAWPSCESSAVTLLCSEFSLARSVRGHLGTGLGRFWSWSVSCRTAMHNACSGLWMDGQVFSTVLGDSIREINSDGVALASIFSQAFRPDACSSSKQDGRIWGTVEVSCTAEAGNPVRRFVARIETWPTPPSVGSCCGSLATSKGNNPEHGVACCSCSL